MRSGDVHYYAAKYVIYSSVNIRVTVDLSLQWYCAYFDRTFGAIYSLPSKVKHNGKHRRTPRDIDSEIITGLSLKWLM